MITMEISSGKTTIITPCVQLRFSWAGDRWEHEMVSGGESTSIPKIWSVDMALSPDDTLSLACPVYEHLVARIDETKIGRAILDGRSGSNLFTASFSVEEKPEEVVIGVEVSDRFLEPDTSLAAAYLTESPSGITESGGMATMTWVTPESRLIFEADPPAVIQSHPAGMGTIRLQAITAPEPSSKSIRLRYRWRWIALPTHHIWDREA